MTTEIKKVTDEFSVSEQITLADLRALSDMGVKSVICNRPDGEAADQINVTEIEAAATAAGLEMVYLPVTPGKFESEDVDGFLAAMERLPKPTHAYCRTGTRSITLWALYQRRLGVPASQLLRSAQTCGYDLSTALKAGDEATRPQDAEHYDILIIGAGAAGIAAASSLMSRVKDLSIAIVDPAEVHYYQPGWTLVGAGVFKQAHTVKTMASLIPEGVKWIKAAVGAFEPEQNRVTLEDSRPLYYERLVVAPGIKLDWHGVDGLVDTLGHNGVTSNYRFDLAPYTWSLVQNLKEGRALFTQPPMPIKCAGAPQKALYLSCDHWLRAGVLDNIEVSFFNAGDVLFGVKDYVPALMTYIEKYRAQLQFGHRLVRIDGDSRTAWFETSNADGSKSEVASEFEMIHVCPPQCAPDFVQQSPLADSAGWVDVDQNTLRHKRFDNVWGLGDAMNAPNAKTAAAARMQAPIVANNLLEDMGLVAGIAHYSGYGSCPLTVERGKIVLAEFGYGGKLLPSFPQWLINGKKPSRLAWILKEKILPPVYWSAMLKGKEWMVDPEQAKGRDAGRLIKKAPRLLPCLAWAADYNRGLLGADLLAAVIVTIMLIPQSLAYALLAGLPAEMGLYASILPLVAYALLGTSRTLSVGPVAVVSLMTASAVGSIAEAGSVHYATAAIAMALISGLMLLGMGLLRFGFLANFLSHPVVSGFITASGIIIALSQMRHILGIQGHGDNLPELLSSIAAHLPQVNGITLVTGLAAVSFLFWARRGLQPVLQRLGMASGTASVIAKAGPVLAILVTTLASYLGDFSDHGVALVGEVPRGLPSLGVPSFDLQLWSELAVSALLISIIGFVESVSVGKTLAAKRRQRIDPNQELVALGAANVASAVSAGFPVTGGFSRSVVNFDAGARTPAASILAAGGIALAALLLTPVLFFLPKATLAATIIVAVTSLLDFSVVKRAWSYSLSDFIAVSTTIGATLLLGVELGVLGGILCSVLLHLYKTMRPHIAVVGAVAGTEHFRNVQRHNVITHTNILSLRVDESLYFANASFLEDYVYRFVADNEQLQHVILQCTAVNEIDMSALEALEAINHRLQEQGLTLNLSEVKGPVMDALEKTDFLQHLSGKVFLTHHQAVTTLKPDEIEPYII